MPCESNASPDASSSRISPGRPSCWHHAQTSLMLASSKAMSDPRFDIRKYPYPEMSTETPARTRGENPQSGRSESLGGARWAVAAGAARGGSAEDDDAAGDLAAPERLEPFVDLVELVGPADQLVDLEPAVEVEIDQPREIDVRPHRAVHGALDALFLERHQVRRDRRAHAHGGHADDDGGAARADRVEDLERRRLAADRVEGVVGAAASRQLAHAVHDLLLGGVDRVRGAELAGERELVREQIARDDLARAGQAGALDHVEPDAAAADHQH